MNKFFTRMLCTALVLCSVLICVACSKQEKENPSAAATTIAETTAAPATDEPTTDDPADIKIEADLTKLHAPAASGDLFTGYWHITNGDGAQFEHFVFGFDGNKNAYLLMGTMGFIGVYDIHVIDGMDLFSTKLMYGLNGDYTYEFSKDKKTVVLTNIATNQPTTIEKLDSFSSIPAPMDSFETDEKLLGAWADDKGEYLYFGKDGIMYSCQKNIAFTFFSYTASDGNIHALYSMNEETEENDTYSFKGDKLIFNNYEYSRISADKLV